MGADGGLLVVLACAGRRVPGWRLFAVVERRMVAAGGRWLQVGDSFPFWWWRSWGRCVPGRRSLATSATVCDCFSVLFSLLFFFFFFFFLFFFCFFLFVESKGDDLIGLTATE